MKRNKERKKRKTLGIILIVLVIIILGATYGFFKFTYQTYIGMDLSFANNTSATTELSNLVTGDSFKKPIETVGDIASYYKSAHNINNGVIGWIAIPGTNINYPINFGKGDDYYLKHNWKGDSYWNGSVFLSQNNSGFSNVSLVNGHNMLNGIMFSQLTNFTNKDFFDSKDIYLYNGENGQKEKFKPIIALYCEPNVGLSLGGLDEAARTKEVNRLMSESMYKGIKYTGNNLLLLNTCLSNGSGKHLLVVAEQVN
ncbi:class B sortase [uncultured Clostridium sp.]|uniref:class B sortase n=1 Tax=uncultured Clostridium sp. TaxID=59620 RepID=UPI00262FB2E7|nr:class B sortase [uncultured Clostridium sp.]